MRSFSLFVVFVVAAACGRDRDSTAPVAEAFANPDAPYAFAQPDARFALPGVLTEVSGLGLLADGRLVAVQDEDGSLFLIDPGSGEVTAQVPFGGAGDYEGVERVDRQIFVLSSNGRLDILTDDGAGGFERDRTRLDLPGGCDAEGLGHDPTSDALVVACKERPGGDLNDARALYAFTRRGEPLARGPSVVIGLAEVARYEAASLRRRGVLDALEGPLQAARFKPSAVAVHPATGELWVLSSRVPAIAVLSRGGGVQAYYALPDALFPQPEGLLFLEDGTLFISNEGRSGSPTLLRYSPRSVPGNAASPR